MLCIRELDEVYRIDHRAALHFRVASLLFARELIIKHCSSTAYDTESINKCNTTKYVPEQVGALPREFVENVARLPEAVRHDVVHWKMGLQREHE